MRRMLLPALAAVGIGLLGYELANQNAGRPSPAIAQGSAPPFVENVAELAAQNSDYRRVIYTGPRTQLVLMSIPVGDDVGKERHVGVEQLLFVESGRGKAVLDGNETALEAGAVVAVPSGVVHDVVNVGSDPLKLYTVYSPPNHLPGRIQATKADAEKDEADQAVERRSE